jgi:hypothetical protein
MRDFTLPTRFRTVIEAKNCARAEQIQVDAAGGFSTSQDFSNDKARSVLRLILEWAPAPARLPPTTFRYSSRIGRPSNQHSKISRTPAA